MKKILPALCICCLLGACKAFEKVATDPVTQQNVSGVAEAVDKVTGGNNAATAVAATIGILGTLWGAYKGYQKLLAKPGTAKA